MTSAIGFIIGLALFGAITFLPIYLQVVKGVSPTSSGLQLVPMMGGLLVASIASGAIISRIGRYRIFPIIGSAFVVMAMWLLSQLDIETSRTVVTLEMILLGLGMGLIMQVLILAAQNAVEPANVGVATAGSTMFRQIGGSIGLAVFGALFASHITAGLAGSLPAGMSSAGAITPAAVAALPPDVQGPFLDVFMSALHIVFTGRRHRRRVRLRVGAVPQGNAAPFASQRSAGEHGRGARLNRRPFLKSDRPTPAPSGAGVPVQGGSLDLGRIADIRLSR